MRIIKIIRLKNLKLIIGLLVVIVSFGCKRVDQLNESDRKDVIRQIIRDEKITYLADEFSQIEPHDSTLYFIALYPRQVQKNNGGSTLIGFNNLFDKRDLAVFQEQKNSYKPSIRISRFINDKKVTFYSDKDSLKKNEVQFWLSYPLFNRKKNALIIYLNYYGGMLMGGETVLIYAKKSGKWVRLATIWTFIS